VLLSLCYRCDLYDDDDGGDEGEFVPVDVGESVVLKKSFLLVPISQNVCTMCVFVCFGKDYLFKLFK